MPHPYPVFTLEEGLGTGKKELYLYPAKKGVA